MGKPIRSNGNGEAVVSWKLLLGVFGLLLTLTIASLGWASRSGGVTRQVEVNTAAIAETREEIKGLDEKLDKLTVGQTRIAAKLDVNLD